MESYNVMISRFDTKLFISGERKTLYVKIKLHIKRSEKYYPTSVVIEDDAIISKLKDWIWKFLDPFIGKVVDAFQSGEAADIWGNDHA